MSWNAAQASPLFNMDGEPMYTRPKPKRDWKSIAIAIPCVLGVFIFAVSCACIYFEAFGPECLFVHCVKVIR